MKTELEHLSKRVTKGLMTRREFVGRAAALGVTAAVANSMLATAAKAEGPVKGGMLKLGMSGGESTSSLDPALAASEVPIMNLRNLGDTLVNVNKDGTLDNRLAEEIEASADATTWKFKIRSGVEFHLHHAGARQRILDEHSDIV